MAPRAQMSLPFRAPEAKRSWGGKRANAGRKPSEARVGVAHGPRPPVSRHHPQHVTLRIVRGLPTMREQALVRALRGAFRAGKARFGLRVVHYSIQRDHIHMLVEAVDRRALTRGMHGLDVRIARAVNRALHKRGQVLGDRYHARALRSPREVRNVLRYVLLNARKHGRAFGAWDLASTAVVFDGWRAGTRAEVPDDIVETIAETCAPPTIWLLTTGWRRRGLLHPNEAPGVLDAVNRGGRRPC